MYIVPSEIEAEPAKIQGALHLGCRCVAQQEDHTKEDVTSTQMLCLRRIVGPCSERARCLCRYFTPKEDGKFTALWFYVVPLDEHSTRVINHAVIVQPLPKLVKKLAAARPRWIDHLLLNEIFDGDMAYLAKVAAYLLTVHGRCHTPLL